MSNLPIKVVPAGIEYPSGSPSTTPKIKGHYEITSPTKKANSGGNGGNEGTKDKSFEDVVKKGGDLFAKFIRAFADAVEAQPKSGVKVKSHFSIDRAAGPEGVETTYATTFTTTTDPAKQAAFLRGTVAPAVTKFADGIVNGNIHLGGETVTLRELGAFVTGAEPAISPLFDLIARKFSGKKSDITTQAKTYDVGAEKESTQPNKDEGQPIEQLAPFSFPGLTPGTVLKGLAASSTNEELGALVRRFLDEQTPPDKTPPDDGPKTAA